MFKRLVMVYRNKETWGLNTQFCLIDGDNKQALFEAQQITSNKRLCLEKIAYYYSQRNSLDKKTKKCVGGFNLS